MTYLKKNGWARKTGLVLVDMLLVSAALYLALVLRYECGWNPEFSNTFRQIPILLCIYCAALIIGGFYDILWRYAGISEALRLGVISLIACAISIGLDLLLKWSISRAALCIHALLAALLIVGSRILWRLVTSKMHAHDEVAKGHRAGPRLMIVGAGMAGSYVLNMCRNDIALGQPVLFVDDDAQKLRQRVQGVRVMGKIADIPKLAKQFEIQEILIAIPSLRGDALNRVVRICQETGCRVRISSRIQSSSDACRPENLYVRELNISDFLSRDEVQLDTRNISDYLSGKTVLVTGGGGSIGSELCRQICHYAPKQLIVFDFYENCAYELECELKQKYGPDCPVLVLIGSVRDRERLEEVFAAYQPQVVFHAAAHKHVPLMEDSPAEAVKNNIFGTMNVLETADKYHVERFVLLSTDKAVNPTNVMGATKRITEMLVQYYAQKTGMKCMAVRFGNVLGSHGSVIPLFEKQIKAGGPVTVTHPDIIRYFMTIPEAAQLVLQAGGIAISGSIFVLDMGEPVRIEDLAKQLIRFYGYEPGVNMDIVHTGLRPGEKLYEELLMDDEKNAMARTSHDKIMIAPPIEQDAEQFALQLATLRAASEFNDDRVVSVLHVMVPTFVAPDAEEGKAVS